MVGKRKTYPCEAFLSVLLLNHYPQQRLFLRECRRAILGILKVCSHLRECGLVLFRPLLPFGCAQLCLCKACTRRASCAFGICHARFLLFMASLQGAEFTFQYLATVTDAAELLQLRFIRLGLCDKHREVLELLCGAPEIIPVGLLP
jgi:hypothetical protein